MGDGGGELGRHRVAHGVGDVDRARPGVDRPLDHFAEKIRLGPGGVLGGEFEIVEALPPISDRLRGRPDDLLLGQLELELPVDRAGGEKDVEPAAGGIFERLRGAIDVLAIGAGEGAHQRTFHRPGDGGDRLEIAGGGGGKAEFDHVDPQVAKRDRHRRFLLQIHARARSLLAVAQRGIEDDHSVIGTIVFHWQASSKGLMRPPHRTSLPEAALHARDAGWSRGPSRPRRCAEAPECRRDAAPRSTDRPCPANR